MGIRGGFLNFFPCVRLIPRRSLYSLQKDVMSRVCPRTCDWYLIAAMWQLMFLWDISADSDVANNIRDCSEGGKGLR